jgi:hypothetical protein
MNPMLPSDSAITHDRKTPLTFLRKLAFLGATALASFLLFLPVPSRAPAQGAARILNKLSPLPFPSPFATPVAPAVNRPDVLDLELAVTQAELILAVRLVEVTETRIVHGGRDVQDTEQ